MKKSSKVGYGVVGVALVAYSFWAFAGDVGPMYIGKTPSELNFFLDTAGNSTYNLVQNARYDRTINGLTARCGSGTIKASLMIDGTDVTDCSGSAALGSGALSVSSTAASDTCSTNNVMGLGQVLSLVTDTNSSCLNLSVSVNETR